MSTFKKIHPDWDGMRKNFLREGTPSRVYYFEHGIAGTMLDAFDRRFAICDSLPAALPHRELHRHVAIHRFLGMEWFRIFFDRLTEAKQRYGDRLTLLGGLDVDFLARADEQAVRAKTREVLRICQPGGGYFLGSGNWVTDDIPFQNYLAMLDEARNVA